MSSADQTGWNGVSKHDDALDNPKDKHALDRWNEARNIHEGGTVTVNTKNEGGSGRLILRDEKGKSEYSFKKGDKLTVDGQGEYRKLGGKDYHYVHVHDNHGHSGWVAAEYLKSNDKPSAKPQASGAPGGSAKPDVELTRSVHGHSLTPVQCLPDGGKRYLAGDDAYLSYDGGLGRLGSPARRKLEPGDAVIVTAAQGSTPQLVYIEHNGQREMLPFGDTRPFSFLS
jgi:hypothetical protein